MSNYFEPNPLSPSNYCQHPFFGADEGSSQYDLGVAFPNLDLSHIGPLSDGTSHLILSALDAPSADSVPHPPEFRTFGNDQDTLSGEIRPSPSSHQMSPHEVNSPPETCESSSSDLFSPSQSAQVNQRTKKRKVGNETSKRDAPKIREVAKEKLAVRKEQSRVSSRDYRLRKKQLMESLKKEVASLKANLEIMKQREKEFEQREAQMKQEVAVLLAENAKLCGLFPSAIS